VSFAGGPYGLLINRGYIHYRETIPLNDWNKVPSEEIRRSNQLLKNYETEGRGIIEDRKWREKFWVTFRDGSIEAWSFEGSLEPFRIDKRNRGICVEKGTIIPVPETDGSPPWLSD
jgi:hypothetical protein